jgi:hypothetical protein
LLVFQVGQFFPWLGQFLDGGTAKAERREVP